MPKKQKFPHLVGSKWTAKQKTWGWRHFQVVNRKNQGDMVFAEMVAGKLYKNKKPIKTIST